LVTTIQVDVATMFSNLVVTYTVKKVGCYIFVSIFTFIVHTFLLVPL